MDSWNRTWGRGLLSRIPIEKTAIGVVVAVSAGIFVYSRAQRDAAAGPLQMNSSFPGRAAPSGVPYSPRGASPLPSGQAQAQTVPASAAPAAAVAAAPATAALPVGQSADAGAPAAGWQAPRAPQLRGGFSPAARAAASGGGGGGDALGGAAKPAAPQSLLARAAAAVTRALGGGAPARAEGARRGLSIGGGGGATSRGGMAGTSASAESAAGGTAGGPLGSEIAAGGPAEDGGPLFGAKDKAPSANPTASNSPGAISQGGGGLSKQEVAERREDLRLRDVCLRTQCGRPGLALAEAALKRRRDAAKTAEDALTAETAKLRQGTSLEPAVAASVAGLAAALDQGGGAAPAPLKEIKDAGAALDKAQACMDELRAETDLPADAAAADACHARALAALDQLKDADAQLQQLRQSGAATLGSLAAGVAARGGATLSDRAEASALQGLRTGYDKALAAADAGAAGASDPPSAAEVASTRRALPTLARSADEARANTLVKTKEWADERVPKGPELDALKGDLDEAEGALTDASKLWTAAAASEAAASDAGTLTKATRELVGAMGDLKAADKPLSEVQDRAYGTVTQPVKAPTSSSCAALK